jgi:dTDP-4-amino-4,6-dideoxy-D-galactose acyltransferase
MMLDQLPWDSDFYGFQIAKVKLTEYSEELIQEMISEISNSSNKLVYLFDATRRLNLDHFLRNKDHSIQLVDKKVVYRKLDFSSGSDHINDSIKKLNAINSELLLLAFRSGIYSRFKLDQQLPRGKFERMYELWLERSVSGVLADVVYGYYDGDKMVGFVTVKLSQKYASIGLIAVHEQYSGKGIGSKLLQAAEEYAIRNGLHEMQVATQLDNLPACKFYESNGYSIMSIENIYHVWRKDDHI